MLVRKMKQFNLTLDEALAGEIIPKKPYSSKEAFCFLKNVRDGNSKRSLAKLEMNKRLIFEYDLVTACLTQGLAECLSPSSKKRATSIPIPSPSVQRRF